MKLTSKEWDVILFLVNTGENECPWSWEDGWPADIGWEEVEVITSKFKQFVKAVKKEV